MINQYAIVGKITETPKEMQNAGYLKFRVKIENEHLNRVDMLELVAKNEGEWVGQATVGAIVACSGALGGKINDKGYCNLSLYAKDVKVLVQAGATRQPVAAAAASNEDEEDIPF